MARYKMMGPGFFLSCTGGGSVQSMAMIPVNSLPPLLFFSLIGVVLSSTTACTKWGIYLGFGAIVTSLFQEQGANYLIRQHVTKHVNLRSEYVKRQENET